MDVAFCSTLQESVIIGDNYFLLVRQICNYNFKFMRVITFLLLALFFITGCESDDRSNRNPFLFDTNFNIQLSAIETLDLEIPANSIYTPIGGIGGVFVINTGSGLRAWEASDPNHAPSNCSIMVIDGISVQCQCDDAHSYNLFTGQAEGEVLEFTMLSYRVSNNGGIITVSN